MPDRFYAPGAWQCGDEFPLLASEAQHISRVLRMQAGESIEVFNGQGGGALAELIHVGKREVSIRVCGDVVTQPEPTVRITLAVASPKGDRFRWMLEKLTELGVDRLIPLRTERGVVDPRESRLEKLEQNVIAACKQCGRNRLMELTQVHELRELLSGSSQCCLYGDAAGRPLSGQVSKGTGDSVLVIVGPEGGFTEGEQAMLRDAGASPVRVGRHILRIETAAVALASGVLTALD